MIPINPCIIPTSSLELTLSGPINNLTALAPRIHSHTHHIAVDGGLNHLEKINLIPDTWIGDADSVNSNFNPNKAPFKCELHPKIKDSSDFALALDYAKKYFNFEKISVYGGFGNRIDHTLSNLYTAAISALPIFFETEEEITFFCDDLIIIQVIPGQTISLMPLSPCVKVSTSGLKWELKNTNLNASFFSLSNKALSNTVSISKKEGLLAIILRTTLI